MNNAAASPGRAAREERSLARAFASFTEAAGSLERSYAVLQLEVARLRQELEGTNRELAAKVEENRRMREHLNRILEGLPCGVLVFDGEGSVSIVNPAARQLLELAPGDVCPELAAWPAPLREALTRARQNSRELEYGGGTAGWEGAGAPGAGRWFSIRHAWLEPAGGSSVYILRDITDQKRLEQERELHRREQALAEMSTVLAHEIRNPLASLELFAGLLTEAELGAEARQWVAYLQAGLRTLAATVNNVLHFHGMPQPSLVTADLGQILHWVVQFLRPLAQQAEVRMELDSAVDGVWIAADPHRLQQVLLNLALNAFRYMPAGGVLRLTGRVARATLPGIVEVDVADTGCGIAPEHLARVFEPGFTTRPGSPGLGLAVCRKIMELHQGSIRVASAPGRGTTFTLSFPLPGEAA